MAEPLLHADALLLDLDGVLFRGDEAIPGAAGLLKHLQATSTPFGILTNNSTRAPEEVVDKLAGIGVRLQPRQILTSALVAATRLAQEHGPTQRVFVVGSDSLRDLLRQRDVTLTSDWTEATDVLVGLDRDLCYETMARASLAIGRGARFLGTNNDRSFPSERGFEPGAGALLALLEATTGVAPRVFGKPAAAMFEEALHMLGTDAAHTVMVGDRHETDIVGAARAGLKTIAVTTGASSREALARCQPPPDWILPSVQEVLEALQAARR